MMSTGRPYKRRVLNFSIQRTMQLRMIGKIAVILFLSLLLSSVVFYYFADQEITGSFRLFHIRARNFLDFLLPVVIASFCISLLSGAVASLFFPKNYAGPLYRIEEDVKRFGAMDFSRPITLRKNDENASLAAQINLLVDRVSSKLLRIQHAAVQAQGFCLHGEITTEDRAKLLKLMQTIQGETSDVRHPDADPAVQRFT